MLDFKLIVLFVEDTAASASFYKELLKRPVLEQTPNFALLPLNDQAKLGLWSRHMTTPPVAGTPGSSELAFAVATAQDLQSLYEEWQARGVQMSQSPTRMDFGETFTALDPDGHRIRIFTPM
jgi:catechol-2,3-dioxygenase